MREYSTLEKEKGFLIKWDKEQDDYLPDKSPFNFSYFTGKGFTSRETSIVKGFMMGQNADTAITTYSKLDFKTNDKIEINGETSRISEIKEFYDTGRRLGGNRFKSQDKLKRVIFIG